MTVIAALHQNGETWIGADSRVTGADVVPTTPRKWHMAESGGDQIGLANSGCGRLFGILRDNAPTLLREGRAGVQDRIREMLIGFGFVPRHTDTVSPDFGSYMMLADREGIMFIDGSLATWPLDEGVLYAIGSGSDYAQGAGHALRGQAPEKRMAAALNAALAFDPGCGGSLFVHRLGDPLR